MFVFYARPHPGPLPQEREKVIQLFDESSAGVIATYSEFRTRGNINPLPGGEDTGEGGRKNKTNANVANFVKGSVPAIGEIHLE
jgi:hypothetical protein